MSPMAEEREDPYEALRAAFKKLEDEYYQRMLEMKREMDRIREEYMNEMKKNAEYMRKLQQENVEEMKKLQEGVRKFLTRRGKGEGE